MVHAAFLLSLLVPLSQASAQNDLTGEWAVETVVQGDPIDEVGRFSQSANSLTVVIPIFERLFTGTIDQGTGSFHLEQETLACTLPNPPSCQIDAVLSLDGSSFSGTYSCAVPGVPDCIPLDGTIEGSRACGDGLLNPGFGELCDDGNLANDDCCSSSCMPQNGGLACEDGDSSTFGDRCLAGFCAGVPPFGAEFQVNVFTTGTQRLPDVATDGAGNFLLVWESEGQDLDQDGVFARLYDRSGYPLTSEFQVNTEIAGNQDRAAVGMGSTGNSTVVWRSEGQDGSSGGIFSQRFDSSGARLGSEFQVNAYTVDNQRGPDVAQGPNDDFVVVWASAARDGDNYGVFARRFDSTGAPVGGEFQVNTYTPGRQWDTQVAEDSQGRFVVVWFSDLQDGDSGGIFAQRFDSSGARLGSEFQVHTTTSGFQGSPALAVDAGGGFVVAWESGGQDGDASGVFAQRFDSQGMPLGSELQVNTYTTASQGFPSASIDGSGNVVIVWDTNAQAGHLDVKGQRFDSAGNRKGSEFQVNLFTRYSQGEPAVSSSPDGAFVVAWHGRIAGDAAGVAARRFTPHEIDAFKCYKAKDLKMPKFAGASVSLADQFSVNDGTFDVKKPFLHCNPADLNDVAPMNEGSHLVCYKTKGPKLSSADRPHVLVGNVFGTQQLEIIKPLLLCVPSDKTVLP